MRYIVALDQGTTSSRAVVADQHGNFIAKHSIEYEQLYPQPGWVEHDPFEILRTQKESLHYAVQKAGIAPEDIAAIGIANQRETTLVWERSSGKPVCNAIVWQCRRTAGHIKELCDQGNGAMITQKTGLVPDAYFSASKVAWILANVPGAREKAQSGELCFGTVDSWLIYNLTCDKRHVTDDSNASRTMLYNLHTGTWDEELLTLFDIPRAMLAEIVPSSGIVGMLDSRVLGREIPIAALAGDQHAALFGQACFEPGMVKNTYGTGCFLLMNTGEKPVVSRNHLLSTVAWSLPGKRTFALEGSIFVAGAVVQWLRDEMKLIESSAQSEEVALSVPDSGGVYLVPAFTGLGAPHWDMYGRGTIVGLTRGSGRAHIVRAALESIALQTADVIAAMREDSGMAIDQMRVDGGASANDFLMQFQADLLAGQVIRPTIAESTAMGVVFLAGLAVGLWESQREIAGLWHTQRTFHADMPQAQRQGILSKWHRAVDRARDWAREDCEQ